MKKIILTALVAVASLSASAQFYVGGALGFRSSKANSDAPSQSVFTLAPEIGYDIDENWTVGADINLAFGNNKVGENIGVEVYGRYNYLKTGIATLFVELGVGYSSNKFDEEIGSIEKIGSTANAAAAAYGDFDPSELASEFAAFGGFTRADAEEAEEGKAEARKSFNISVRPGVKIALSDKVSLVAKTGLLGYKKYTDKGPSEFNIGVNNDAIKLGVYYSF